MSKGIALIELIIAIVLFSVFLVAVSWAYVAGVKIWNSGKNRAEIVEDGSLAMDRMVREIGQADSITEAIANEISFLADLDDNGVNETIAFSVNNNQLIRTEDALTPVLAPNVQTFTLSYRDLDNTLLTIPQDTSSQTKRDKIRVITITLTLNKADDTVTLSSSAYARNQ